MSADRESGCEQAVTKQSTVPRACGGSALCNLTKCIYSATARHSFMDACTTEPAAHTPIGKQPSRLAQITVTLSRSLISHSAHFARQLAYPQLTRWLQSGCGLPTLLGR